MEIIINITIIYPAGLKPCHRIIKTLSTLGPEPVFPLNVKSTLSLDGDTLNL